jgi:hypothetical protein
MYERKLNLNILVELPLSNVLPSVYNENGCFDKKKKRSNTERK